MEDAAGFLLSRNQRTVAQQLPYLGRRHKVERNGEEKKKDTGESNEIMRDRK